MRDRGRGFFNSGLIQWLRYRRPLSTTSVRIRLFAGAPCNSNDDNRRHSVRYKVSRVCHAIVYLPAVWEWKKEPFVFFFPPFSYLFPFSPLLSLFSLFLSRLFFPPPPLFSFFFIKHHVAKERGLRGGSSRRGQRHVLRECFSLHTVYTEQCGPDN